MTPAPLAHSANSSGRTHDLGEHLRGVADLAGWFAAAFGSGGYARAAGLWHDLGKNAPDFQARLAAAADPDAHVEAPGRVDHSSAGAVHALETLKRGLGLPLAFVIAGHHAGLADYQELETRLRERVDRLTAARANPAAVIPSAEPPALPDFLRPRVCATEQAKQDFRRQYEFWVRMLFSCLVDADWLDTEAHFDPDRSGRRGRSRDAIPALLERFDRAMSKFASAAGAVNGVRARVLADCRARGRARPPGVFTLTAPTGAGKTLAGMAFALEHARQWNKDRVVVVIPYTSIIDQNAAVYRQVFGPDNVIDHHASLDPRTETHRNRLASENWDAPVVVTTSVQFFESLFANRPSRCRKLHNVCDSVVICDEVQTLPVPHLLPIVDVLKELVANYGVTLVLSTATQPALGLREFGDRFPGFERVTEIVSDVPRAFAELRRVEVRMPADPVTPTTWPDLARELAGREEVLAVVHRRDDARELVRELDKLTPCPDTIHLSALMCPAHRLWVIGRVKGLLEANRRRRDRGEAAVPVRAVSTQLVEAGVDLDFPAVYRALGGFDSVAQAAGRCNREGRLARGEVVVFVAPTLPPRGTPHKALEVARAMLAGDPGLDPLDPGLYGGYFRRLYVSYAPDPLGVQALRADWKFRSVGEAFALIEDDGSEPVVVPYGDAPDRLAELRRLGPSRDRLRALQPFVVTLYPDQLRSLEEAGAVEWVAEAVRAVNPATHARLYDDRFGLVPDGPCAADPAALCVG